MMKKYIGLLGLLFFLYSNLLLGQSLEEPLHSKQKPQQTEKERTEPEPFRHWGISASYLMGVQFPLSKTTLDDFGVSKDQLNLDTLLNPLINVENADISDLAFFDFSDKNIAISGLDKFFIGNGFSLGTEYRFKSNWYTALSVGFLYTQYPETYFVFNAIPGKTALRFSSIYDSFSAPITLSGGYLWHKGQLAFGPKIGAGARISVIRTLENMYFNLPQPSFLVGAEMKYDLKNNLNLTAEMGYQPYWLGATMTHAAKISLGIIFYPKPLKKRKPVPVLALTPIDQTTHQPPILIQPQAAPVLPPPKPLASPLQNEEPQPPALALPLPQAIEPNINLAQALPPAPQELPQEPPKADFNWLIFILLLLGSIFFIILFFNRRKKDNTVKKK